MVNAMRGETVLEAGGKKHTICLTLGALAEIETALGGEGLAHFASAMKALRARDITAILGALLRGGGNVLSDDDVAAMRIDITRAVAAIADAFAAAGLGADAPR